MAHSKYTSKLRELGFTMVSPEESAVMERYQEARRLELRELTPNRAAKRAFDARWVAASSHPTFSLFDQSTMATDETGAHWRAQAQVDLTVLGFKNVSMPLGLASFILGGPPDISRVNN